MDSSDFSSLVRKRFDFLISEYGFFISQKDENHVRFESNEVFLTVRYDAVISYEVDVEIGQLNVLFNDQERAFSLGELLRTEGTPEGDAYRPFQVLDSSVLERCISKLALLVSSSAKEYLLNNRFIFKRLSDRREFECEQYELKVKLDGIRREAQMAWDSKNYSKVVALYEPIESMISEVEKKKLIFAQKHTE